MFLRSGCNCDHIYFEDLFLNFIWHKSCLNILGGCGDRAPVALLAIIIIIIIIIGYFKCQDLYNIQ